jgi:hypothetical protein
VGIEWSSDVGQAAWWIDVLHPFARDVGSVVPDSFAAYARVFHPAGSERWSDIAARTGRVVHTEMQYDPIASTDDGGDLWLHERPLEGTLNGGALTGLAELLAQHTSTPQRCWFAIWDGYGQLHGGAATVRTMLVREPGSDSERVVRSRAKPLLAPKTLDGPRINAPGRDYFLASGALEDISDFFVQVGRQSPNVWWPADRAWIVATEIDFCWTYVAGDRAAIDAVLSEPDLEALESQPDHGINFDSDTINL